MKRLPVIAVMLIVAAACGGAGSPRDSGAPADAAPGTVRLLFAGDVMLGRGVAAVAAAEGPGLFEAARHVISGADVAVANLESPLTDRRHVSSNPNDLTVSPAVARLLAGAGFDAMGLANNHAGDAGPESVTDTVQALAAEGLEAIGAGDMLVVETGGPTVAYLAYDLTRQGVGVAHWHDDVESDVAAAGERAEIVTVSIHGGGEYRPQPDPGLREVAGTLAGWGVDIVWAHGAHVRHPVELIDPDGDGRATVVAYGLGNFLFDQTLPGTDSGSVLEVMVSAAGVVAYRLGVVEHDDLRVRFAGWDDPVGDAVYVAGGWWELGVPVDVGPAASEALGDVTGDGVDDLVVAFRRPFRETPVSRLLVNYDWVDADGRSAHLGVYRPDDRSEVWVAGSLGRPVAEVAACDGAVAVAYETLDAPTIVAGGAWEWSGFGSAPAPDLPGGAVPGCADVDGDARSDPVLVGRFSE